MDDRLQSAIDALEKVSRALDQEISIHRCCCVHPCEDYFVHPGPCGMREAESYRNIKIIADKALRALKGETDAD